MKSYKQRLKSQRVQLTILRIFGNQEPPLTVRQVYYALTVKGAIAKTEGGYRQTCYQLGQMREAGIIPYGWIADNTRWRIKPRTESTLEDALQHWQEAYRRDLWIGQPTRVEIWVEKDALAGVISPVTQEYDVPLYVCRGYSSTTFLYEAAEQIKSAGKPTYIYHFGDFDPSGVDAAHKVRDGLVKHGAHIHFTRAAVIPEQIANLNLPTRETKKSDPRSRVWGDMPSVELDAIPATFLRGLVRGCIQRHLNPEALAFTLRIEESEKETLAEFRRNFVQAQNSHAAGE